MEAARSTRPPTAKNIRKALRKLRSLKLENAALNAELARLRKTWNEREEEIQELHHEVFVYGTPAELHSQIVQLRERMEVMSKAMEANVQTAWRQGVMEDRLQVILRDLQDATYNLALVLKE